MEKVELYSLCMKILFLLKHNKMSKEDMVYYLSLYDSYHNENFDFNAIRAINPEKKYNQMIDEAIMFLFNVELIYKEKNKFLINPITIHYINIPETKLVDEKIKKIIEIVENEKPKYKYFVLKERVDDEN